MNHEQNASQKKQKQSVKVVVKKINPLPITYCTFFSIRKKCHRINEKLSKFGPIYIIIAIGLYTLPM